MPFEGEKFEDSSTPPIDEEKAEETEGKSEETAEEEKIKAEVVPEEGEKQEEVEWGKEESPEIREEVESEKKPERELEEIRERVERIKEEELREKEIKEAEKEKEKKSEMIKAIIGESVPEKFKDLVGNDSEEAWGKRKELFEKDPVNTAASLAGTNSEKSRTWLEANKDSQKMWWGISRGLIGDDSERAWAIREHLKFDQKVERIRGGRIAEFKEKLGLHKSERLFNLRGKMKQLLGWYEPGDVVISTTGLDSERAWGTREEFEKVAPAEVLMSLAGLDSEKAQKIRDKYREDKRLEWALRKSLVGVEKNKE